MTRAYSERWRSRDSERAGARAGFFFFFFFHSFCKQHGDSRTASRLTEALCGQTSRFRCVLSTVRSARRKLDAAQIDDIALRRPRAGAASCQEDLLTDKR